MPAEQRLIPRGRHRRGRNEQAIDRAARLLQHDGVYDEFAAARAVLARTLARELDNLEDDPAHSGHTIGTVGRVLREVISDLASHQVTSDDDLDRLLAALDAPADPRHSSQP